MTGRSARGPASTEGSALPTVYLLCDQGHGISVHASREGAAAREGAVARAKQELGAPRWEYLVDGQVTVEVTELRPEMGGRWDVTARTSRHVWDLDAMRYTRTPGPAATLMGYDGVAVPIGRVAVWPVVGQQSLLFYDDPNDPSTEHYRACSTIESITAMPTADPGEPP